MSRQFLGVLCVWQCTVQILDQVSSAPWPALKRKQWYYNVLLSYCITSRLMEVVLLDTDGNHPDSNLFKSSPQEPGTITDTKSAAAELLKPALFSVIAPARQTIIKSWPSINSNSDPVPKAMIFERHILLMSVRAGRQHQYITVSRTMASGRCQCLLSCSQSDAALLGYHYSC